jgi:HEAT repeat protein/outer membrane protein assembly factor BamD (BamD/ComL family)
VNLKPGIKSIEGQNEVMKHVVTFRPRITIVLVLLAVVSVAYGRGGSEQEIAKLDRFVQSTKGNTASMQIFREGRDQIEAQNWQKAAEIFNQFIAGYPKDKDLDAALYWYGYALQKQGRKEDAKAPLLRLINRFPNSSWRREAEALLVVLGEQDAVKKGLERDNCEIKMLALQSLFQADEERAIAIVMEAIKANPTQCEGFQAVAVSMLARNGGARAVPVLLDVARSNPDLKLRLTAIRALGDQREDQITDELIKLYDTDKTKEIRYQVLRALAQRQDERSRQKLWEIARQGETPELRIEAIRRLSDHGRLPLDELIKLYDTEANLGIKQGLLRAFADNKDPRAQAKLLDIARNAQQMELRGFAIRQLSDNDDEQTIGQFVAMYDSEQNQQVKMMLIRAFGNSKQKVAVRKLMTIARNDQSVELRKVAVRYLGESKDPEALKFLEELLK